MRLSLFVARESGVLTNPITFPLKCSLPRRTNRYVNDSDADAAAYGGDELRAQGATVPPDAWSLD